MRCSPARHHIDLEALDSQARADGRLEMEFQARLFELLARADL